MTKKLIVFLLLTFVSISISRADTNTDILGSVILKKNFRLYIDKGRADGVETGNRLDILYNKRSFGNALISWVGDDIAYTKLDSSTYYRFYYIEPLELRIYLESSARYTGGTIHVPFFNDIKFKPSEISNPDENALGYLIYDNLVRLNDEGGIEPGLANTWEFHGNTYTFYLNQNVKFHSGKYLEALDVAYSLVQLAKSPSLTPASSFITQVDGYEEVNRGGRNELRGVFIANKYTIAITTKDSFVPFLKYLAGSGGFIIPAVDRMPVPIGTGPFKIGSMRDDKIVLMANPDYYETASSLDSIIFVRYKDFKEAALEFELGRLDLAYFDSEDAGELLSGGDYLTRKYYTSSLVLLGFNCNHEYQKNFKLSKALTHLFDRQSIVRVLLGNSARASTSLIAHTLGYESSYADNQLYLPGEIKTELKKIDNLPAQLDLVYDDSDPALESVADYIAGQIRHAGLKVEIQKAGRDQLGKSISVNSMDLYLFRYDLPVPDADALFYPLFSKALDGKTNFFGYDNPQLERFLNGARRIEDEYARRDIYQEAEELIMDNPPMVVLYNPYITVAHRRDLAGFNTDKRAFVDLRGAYFQAGR